MDEPARHPVRLVDVARVAGVSTATASRALSGSASVDAELVRRVTEAGRRLGYRRDGAAQMTANGNSSLVGVVTDEPRSAWFSETFAGLRTEAEEQGLTALVASSRDSGSLVTAGQSIAGFRPRAIVVVARRDLLSTLESQPTLRRMTSTIPTTVIGRTTDALTLPGVDPTHLETAAELVAALGTHGYERPLVLDVDERYPSERERGAALLAGSRLWAPRSAVARAAAPSRSGGYDAMARVLAEGDPPDLVLAVSDELAMGAIAALRRDGLISGRDVGVTGFGDLAFARELDPPLTTVRTHSAGAGRRALRIALREPVTDVPPRAEIMFRASTRP